MNTLLSSIPNMNSLLEHAFFEGISHERVKQAGRDYLDELRDSVKSGEIESLPSLDECARQVLLRIEEDPRNLRGLINATGVILHTNLGRAPLGEEMCAAALEICAGYCNLEYDLETGSRGSRYSHLEELICKLVGAEASMVVNNNAAATLLMLCSIAQGNKVAISRGEMVEIGGSLRIPEIIKQSGSELIEVGSTNKTRLSDYVEAVEDKNAKVLLKVHTSNYEIVGFTESVSVSELAEYGKSVGLPVLYDMGSCFLVEPELLGLSAGETAVSGIGAGADVICFSGDKLMGSAQAGIIAGRSEYITAMKKHPLTRAIRPDKLTLSILEAALRLYRFPEEAIRRVPVLAMLSYTQEELRQRAEGLAERLKYIFKDWCVSVCETMDETGGGSLPNVPLPGWAVALKPSGMSVNELEDKLRRGRMPVIIRISDNKAIISPRTLLESDEDRLIEALKATQL